MKCREQVAGFIGIDFDVFLNAVCRKESNDGAGFEQFFAHDLIEKLLPIVE